MIGVTTLHEIDTACQKVKIANGVMIFESWENFIESGDTDHLWVEIRKFYLRI